jgi:hypothetical protein
VSVTAPTLAVTNNDDGTATATLTDGTALATNTVYRAAWTGAAGGLTWVSFGSRTGPGTVGPTAVSVGNYFWKCDTDLAGENATSNLVYRRITDGTNSVYYSVLEAVQSEIEGLGLDNIAAVYLRKLPSDHNVTLPNVQVTLPVSVESVPSWTNATDDTGWPVQVTLVKASNGSLTLDDEILQWRESIVNHFIHQRLAGISTSLNCEVEYMAVVDETMFEAENLDISSLILRFLTRRTRG